MSNSYPITAAASWTTREVAYRRVIEALELHGSTVRDTGSTAQAQCPAHPDRNPSLSVRAIESQTLLYCHAGCPIDDVLAALGLTMADLFDDKAGVAYRYDDGRTAHRSPEKKFWQTGNTQGTPQLYRLEKVRRAVIAGERVWLVEGEKDVHALESLGEVATTAPMGATNFSKVDAGPLVGAMVHVIPDQDRAGVRWLADVRAALKGKAASLQVYQPAIGKDAADHVAAGLGIDQFITAPDQSGDGRPDVRTLASVVPERVSQLWPGRLPLGKLVVLDGDPSVGKSTLTLDLAARVSRGAAWPDGAASRGPADVILMSAEDGLADTIRPRLDAAGADPYRVHALLGVHTVDDKGNALWAPPSLPRHIAELEAAIVQHRARLVVVDVLMAYLSGKVDAHRDQDVRGVLHELAAMAERTECCVLLIRHLRKSHGGQAMYAGGGSIGIIGAARAAFVAGRDPGDDSGTRRVLAATKFNLGPEPPALAYRLVGTDTGVARVEWEPDPVAMTAGQLLAMPVEEDERTERDEAAEWLVDYLERVGGEASSKDVKKAARGAEIAQRTLERARSRAGVKAERRGFPSVTVWAIDPKVTPQSRLSRQGADAGATGVTVAQLGPESPPCAVCGNPMKLALPGQRTHPNCNPEEPAQ